MGGPSERVTGAVHESEKLPVDVPDPSTFLPPTVVLPALLWLTSYSTTHPVMIVTVRTVIRIRRKLLGAEKAVNTTEDLHRNDITKQCRSLD